MTVYYSVYTLYGLRDRPPAFKERVVLDNLELIGSLFIFQVHKPAPSIVLLISLLCKVKCFRQRPSTSTQTANCLQSNSMKNKMDCLRVAVLRTLAYFDMATVISLWPLTIDQFWSLCSSQSGELEKIRKSSPPTFICCKTQRRQVTAILPHLRLTIGSQSAFARLFSS